MKNKYIVKIKCFICKKSFYRNKSRAERTERNVCSLKCRGHLSKGSNNKCWKGGRVLRNGYMSIKTHDHPFRDAHNYIFEHRLVVEKRLGRYLQPNEIVHHKNHNILDNRPSNLEVLTRDKHVRLHPRKRNKKGQYI